MKRALLSAAALALTGWLARAGEIDRIWLTHDGVTPEHLVVNWETGQPGDSRVEYSYAGETGISTAAQTESVTLHHVRIPLARRDVSYRYRVRSGEDSSPYYTFQGYPSAGELRVALVADTGYMQQPWAEAVLAQKPHLLLTAGDNVPALHEAQPVAPDDTSAFSRLVSRWPALYHSTIWMPALGNHDRELRSRGAKPPPEPVYDPEATAFRKFFALPAPGWHWEFNVPEFGVRFVAADLSHLSDQGSTWQTCHSPAKGGEQLEWFSHAMTESREPFLIPIDNEKNSTVRGLEGGAWGKLLAHASAVISGFGYFAERAESGGVPYYNTSVSGTGTPYPDPGSQFLKSTDNFVLLTFHSNPKQLRIELRDLEGEVLDAKDFAPRELPPAAGH
jgi:hypothetical protein